MLYAASNLGSMLALLAYPVVVERLLRLHAQSHLWAWGYGALVVLAAACALALWRARPSVPAGEPASPLAAASPGPATPDGADRPITRARRARWVLLAAVPSSLMLSVTTYLSTDIAAIPLLWVVPLAIYLLTFILVFGRRRIVPHRVWAELLPVALLPLVLVLVARANEPLALVIPTHLAVFFVAAMVCHGELARDQPDPRHLTEFYLWLSVGGVVGGAFTALLAPIVFTNVLEYPLVLALLPLLPARPPAAWLGRTSRILDLLLPLGLGALTVGLLVGLERAGYGAEAIGPAVGLVTLLCLAFWRRPVRFALGLAALLLAGAVYQGEEGRLLYAERSFFGVSRVTRDPSGQYHMLMHGTTLHGMQRARAGAPAGALDVLPPERAARPVLRGGRRRDPAAGRGRRRARRGVARLLREAGPAVDVLRDRPRRARDRRGHALLHVPAGLPAQDLRHPRRRPAHPGPGPRSGL